MPRAGWKRAGVCRRVPVDARAEPDGWNEVRVAGDEQGVELDRRWAEKWDQNVSIMMSLLSHCPSIPYLYSFSYLVSIKYADALDVQPYISDQHTIRFFDPNFI